MTDGDKNFQKKSFITFDPDANLFLFYEERHNYQFDHVVGCSLTSVRLSVYLSVCL